MEGSTRAASCEGRVFLPAIARYVVAASAALLLLAPAVDAVVPSAAPKTLSRFHDPVIVSTGTLTELPDRRTASWRLYASEAGHLVPIPFQFDARARQGDVVVGRADEFTAADNDELVFMAKDTGQRDDNDPWPEGTA